MNKPLIIFRVIGNQKIGLGHIYRALTIADELKDNKIIFVSDLTNKKILINLVPNNYNILVFKKSEVIKKIIKMKPDLVINDILSTKIIDVLPLKENKIKTINFEDLGLGAKYADLTINEIHDKPLNNNKNTLWGSNYFFLRKEFNKTTPISFNKKISNVLITFGGSDQYNLTLKTYLAIKDMCKKNHIRIHIVTGPAYKYSDILNRETYLNTNVEIHHSTGIMSKIMNSCDIAISSNGRTIFELAHMNLPTIVIPQHLREQTHTFSSSKTGFILLNMYKKDITLKKLKINFSNLIQDNFLRKTLYTKMKKFNFVKTKNKSISMINKILIKKL